MKNELRKAGCGGKSWTGLEAFGSTSTFPQQKQAPKVQPNAASKFGQGSATAAQKALTQVSDSSSFFPLDPQMKLHVFKQQYYPIPFS